jgi:hypothetical protein
MIMLCRYAGCRILFIILLIVNMLTAKCRYAECRGAFIVLINII